MTDLAATMDRIVDALTEAYGPPTTAKDHGSLLVACWDGQDHRLVTLLLDKYHIAIVRSDDRIEDDRAFDLDNEQDAIEMGLGWLGWWKWHTSLDAADRVRRMTEWCEAQR